MAITTSNSINVNPRGLEATVITADGATEYVKAAGFRANFITLLGGAFGGNAWQHTFDNLKVSAAPAIGVSPNQINAIAGDTTDEITVSVPKSLIQAGVVEVTAESLTPGIVGIEGAGDNGKLVLSFAATGALPPVADATVFAAFAATGALPVAIDATAAAGGGDGAGFRRGLACDVGSTSSESLSFWPGGFAVPASRFSVEGCFALSHAFVPSTKPSRMMSPSQSWSFTTSPSHSHRVKTFTARCVDVIRVYAWFTLSRRCFVCETASKSLKAVRLYG